MNDVLYAGRISTPLGGMNFCATEQGICSLTFSEEANLKAEFEVIAKKLNVRIVNENHPLLSNLEIQLKEYFDGSRKTFTLPLHLIGTPFQEKVWNGLVEIPYGTARSYKEQAKRLEMPNAIRAVAQTNGLNRIAIVVPCHRVIGEGGALTGYAGGLWRKQWLLEHEGVIGKLL